MLLSKLEIKGFKSFGDKINLSFDAGITGIVGPNGCGKSNIVDAIRWVLGEQKIKNLRSEKMENVIFNGSKNRRPLQMAEVSLTFENNRALLPTEYAQVTITRRYYRSGDSEYLLNGITCRLKDITDLFLDTGIGSDSYAIIELKMVDELLNDKENSRRSLFEEAAGISKFKIRKKQSLRKLEETDADLARVDDLLFEITKNLKSLERQARQAEKYTRLKADYKRFSIELAKISIQKLEQQVQELNSQLVEQSTQKANLATEAETKENELITLREQLVLQEKTLAEGQRNFNAHFAGIKQLENDLALLKQQLQHTNSRQQTLQTDIARDEAQIETLRQNIALLEQQIQEQQQSVELTRQDLEARKTSTETEKQQLQALQTQAQEAAQFARHQQQQLYHQQKELDTRRIKIQHAQEELSRLEKQKQLHLDSAIDFDQLTYQLQEDLQRKEADLASLQRQDQQQKTQIEETEKQLHAQREELAQHTRLLDAQRNQLNLTRSMVENLEGFPETIKFLSKSKQWQQAPLLSDLITCDNHYKKAIESYLEPYMNHYVAETAEQAQAAIELLKTAGKGRANFFLLPELPSDKTINTQVPAQYLPALTVVNADVKYAKLIHYLFSNVYILPVGATSENNANCTLITEDGTLIYRQALLSGGSVGLFTGSRIGRAKNVEHLTAEVAAIGKKVDELKVNLKSTEATLVAFRQSNLFQPIRMAEIAVQKAQQEILTTGLRRDQQKTTEQNNLQRHEEINQQIQNLTLEIKTLEPHLQQAQEKLVLAEQEAASLQQQWQAQNNQLSLQTGSYNQANLQYHQLKNKLDSAGQELQFKNSTIATTQNRVTENKTNLERAKADAQKLAEEIDKKAADLAQRMVQKQVLSTDLDSLQKEFLQARNQAEQLDRTLRELQRKRQQADELIFTMQSSGNENSLKLVAIKERLSVEFNLTEQDLQELNEQSGLPVSELQANISSLKAKLDALGPVNPMALEAYQEVSERDVFIREQRDDLLKARKSLLDTITEIDTVAKDKYLASFQQIRDNFMAVFRSLFSEEDSCDLIITEPDNPLESRIEIIARPKGKRPLTINQLSGGEKTLTAISLLFAIYLLKPAPFCIFDEVDAPLDDANIDKFNKIIQQFSGQSQFIIVTHNKRTMASTDVIYGITMLEPGVSRVLPVDLRAIA